MYEFLFIGHGTFPQGMKSAAELIVGTKPKVHVIALAKNQSHIDMQRSLESFLKTHKEVVIFADLKGGAPHQTAARFLHAHPTGKSFLVSGAPLAVIINVILSVYSEKNSEKISQTITEEVKNASDAIELRTF